MKRTFSSRILYSHLILFILTLAGAGTFSISGQETDLALFDTIEYTISDNLGLFESDEILKISLKFDITYLRKHKPKEEYLDAIISFHHSDSDSVSQNIRLRSRGNMRNDICTMPPIRLNFEAKNDQGEDIVKNMKLVTHCNNARQFEIYIFKEYLAYKLYNVVTDVSFRVRLLNIRYIDTGSRGLNETRHGFIIEPVDMLERRMSTIEIENLVVRPEFVAPNYFDRLALFQYLIGNSDWDIPSLHNLKAFRFNDTSSPGVCIVPYDFDYSGLVDTHYSVPNPNYPIETVTERVYMGPCRSDKVFRDILDEFMQKRDKFINVLESFEYLDDRRKKTPMNYVESFFDMYNRDEIFYIIKKSCLTNEH